jgi:hypothetical protein
MERNSSSACRWIEDRTRERLGLRSATVRDHFAVRPVCGTVLSGDGFADDATALALFFNPNARRV